MSTFNGHRVKIALVGLFAGVSLTAAAGLVTALTFPKMHVPGIGQLGVGAETRADIAARDGSSLPAAMALSRDALKTAPMNAGSWLRIAYLETRDGSPLGVEGLTAVRNSYSVAPLGPDVSLWRLTFLYEHWAQLTPDIRKMALAEQRAQFKRGTFDPNSIVDPSGRFAAQINAIQARQTPTNMAPMR